MVMLQYWKSAFTGSIAIGFLGGVVGLAGFELSSPASVQAYEARLNVALDREPDETFQTMLKRAEVVARAAVQRAFDTDILATDVSVFINGRNSGLEAPLLSVQISRFQWQSFPDTRRWATYYPSTQSLLHLNTLPTGALTPVNPTPEQDESSKTLVIEDSSFNADGFFVGRIRNVSERPLFGVQIYYEALDDAGNLLDAGSLYVTPPAIEPGGTSTFKWFAPDGATTVRITQTTWRNQ
ncbi:MAG: FxLYD domain-containing protein [Prochlorotrichaceae cyanobacterium]